MKYLDTMQEGGYPFDDVSIDFLQQMHNDRDSFIQAVFGDNKIVKGVILNQTSNLYSDGLITVNGKLYHFVGGSPSTTISKKVIATSRQYEDGNQKKAFINEFYEFGNAGTDAIAVSDLKRWYSNEPILKEFKYVGASVTNATLPEGWKIADGTNGTDDLRSRFIVGLDARDSDYNVVGKTGGEKKHQLTAGELPKVTVNSIDVGQEGDGYPNQSGDRTTYGSENGYLRKAKKFKTEDIGANNESHENRPPFYVAIIIQFVGI